ncbi:MAG: histidine--tRNA ligase [Spirochaetales bacterium]|nr:histidine--tRNA ligase [Spirochaetales bacterium]
MKIEPRVLKGFRDFLPEKEIQRSQIIHLLEVVFQSFGLVPIDTPVLEYADVLLGKGGGETDKQIFAFKDLGKRDVAMRFDLTVPFARFMAAHERDLYLPFKRYHISKVWRGENTQRGRYREFIQCDFDIVGTDSPSSDLEILQLMNDSFEALGIGDFTFRISHRGIFNRFLKKLDLDEFSAEILRIVDKFAKIGQEKVFSMLTDITGEQKKAESILDFITAEKDFNSTLEKMAALAGGEGEDTERLKILHGYLKDLGISHRYILDPSITRGLDYYTGLVYETFLNDLPGIGSVCSGGRYNDLASLYTKTHLPGVGSSIGIDRLIAALEELGKTPVPTAQAEVLILCFDTNLISHYHLIARTLRKGGIRCEVYPEKKKLGNQFNYAEKKGIPLAVICGEDEYAAGKITLKDLRRRESYENLTVEEALAKMGTLL